MAKLSSVRSGRSSFPSLVPFALPLPGAQASLSTNVLSNQTELGEGERGKLRKAPSLPEPHGVLGAASARCLLVGKIVRT